MTKEDLLLSYPTTWYEPTIFAVIVAAIIVIVGVIITFWFNNYMA